MAEIKANLPKTYFAWSGATQNGGLVSITSTPSIAIPPTTTERSWSGNKTCDYRYRSEYWDRLSSSLPTAQRRR
jgi:hypothetical protein